MTETLFIINPVSGGGAALKTWRAARPALQTAGLAIREHVTARAGEAIQVTRAALTEGDTRIVAVGGDGTLSEVVNGYLDDNGRPLNPLAAIGVLPGGTGADFSKTLGITSRARAIQAILGATFKTIDAGRITLNDTRGRAFTRAFINLASFGLGGDTAMWVNRWRGTRSRLLKGQAKYALAALRALDRYRNHRVRVRLDQESELEIGSNLLVVANGKYAGGGMMLAPEARLDDGLFDVILADGATRWDIIKELPRIGRGGHLKNPRVSAHRARVVSITTEAPLAIDVDGDFAGHTPAELVVLPSMIRLLTPTNHQE
ncbi:MAG TPA: diacylglycerol kinase family protein [Blastocatellia bacterium]|nr:diacylglycerol kinase family protein [Blastocatellia bacterium]